MKNKSVEEFSKKQQLKLFRWLRSIRLNCNNGYMLDEDANRIIDKFKSQIDKAVLDGKIEELHYFPNVDPTIEEFVEFNKQRIAELKSKREKLNGEG